MKKAKSGSRRKCDTVRHKKTLQQHRGERRETVRCSLAAQEIERIHNEAEFAERNFTRRDAPEVCTVLKMVCAWCGADMGEKDGEGVEGISHGICEECEAKVEAGTWEPCR